MKAGIPTSVIIPTLNEAKGIGPVLKEIRGALEDPSLLVVDGNSNDGTAEIAKEMGVKVMRQNGKCGKGAAVAQALESLDLNTRYVAFIDADYTYPANNLVDMIEVLEGNPNVGMVMGNRFADTVLLGNAMDMVFYFGNRMIAAIQSLINRMSLRDPLTGLRVIRANILKGWKPESSGFDIEVELNFHIARSGFNIVEIPINYRRRLGQKKLKLHHGLVILKRILLLMFKRGLVRRRISD